MMISEEMVQSDAWKSIKQTLDILKDKKKVLLLSCSNRYNFDEKNIDNHRYFIYCLISLVCDVQI